MKTNTKQSLIALITASAMAIPFAFAAGEPENVNNVAASSKDATTLGVTWDEAMDSESNPVDHYRIYYGTESVQEGDTPSYEVEVDTPDNTTNYDLGGLVTDTIYYLSVTAVDDAETESLEYGIETSATPTEAETGDTTAPTVTNAIAVSQNQVLIGFSEEINLPELLAEAAFTITEQINPANMLEITSATQYTDDPEAKTVILETGAQTKNVNYIVTASVAITDLAGNPIESGSTDSSLFLGSDLKSSAAGEEAEEGEVMEEGESDLEDRKEKYATQADYGDCERLSEKILNCEVYECTIPQPLLLGDEEVRDMETIKIKGMENGLCKIDIIDESNPDFSDTCAFSPDGLALAAETRYQSGLVESGESNYGEEGIIINGIDRTEDALESSDECVLLETSESGDDITPPEDITNFFLTFKEELEKFMIIMNWTASINTAKDLVEQMLYSSADKGITYDSGEALGPIATTHQIPDLEGGKEYTFKITTKDAAGNESVGVIKSIRLPQTGLGAGLLIFGSVFATSRILRRKKSKKDVF